jgi:hypothetical protein
MENPIKPDHDAQIVITLKGNNLHVAAPVQNMQLCKELLILAIAKIVECEQQQNRLLRGVLANGQVIG